MTSSPNTLLPPYLSSATKRRDNSAAAWHHGQRLHPIFCYSHEFYLRCGIVEKRGLKIHRGRVGEALREEIETLVEGELADPRIGLVSVTAVHIADDGRSAQVWVNVEGDDDRCGAKSGRAGSREGLHPARTGGAPAAETRAGIGVSARSRGTGKSASRRIAGAGEKEKQGTQGTRWKKGIATCSRTYFGRSNSTNDSC